jgi:hypothetical protein
MNCPKCGKKLKAVYYRPGGAHPNSSRSIKSFVYCVTDQEIYKVTIQRALEVQK